MKPFLEVLGTRPIFLDGAMGTMLQRYGLAGGELPELWNLSRPEVLREIHAAYRAAGADILLANTFGANRYKLENHRGEAGALVRAGVALAKEAAGDY